MSISSDIPTELALQLEPAYPPGPGKKFFGLNVLIPYYSRYLKFIQKLVGKYGDIVFFQSVSEQIFLVNDPGFIEHILIKNPDNYLRGTGFSKLKMLLGEGLLSTDGAIHKRHRKIIQPSFHKTSMEGYTKTIEDCSHKIIDEWAPELEIDIQEKSVDLFLEVICELLIGDSDKTELIDTINFFDSLTYDYKAFVLIGLPDLAKKLPFPWAKRFYELSKKLDEIVYALIEEKKNSPYKGNDILTLLLEAKDETGQGLSDKEIRDELVTILFASYDTSARTLSWSLYLLSQNPGALRKLLSFDDAKEMSVYADMVISEALRIYPPAHSITRVTDEEDTYGNHTIQAGSSIIISPYLLHRDGNNFTNPMDFIPERWSPENRKNINRLTYLPFGAGKRSCMGEVFARMQVNIALRKFCEEFDFGLNSKVKESSMLTLKPKGKMMFTLQRKHV